MHAVAAVSKTTSMLCITASLVHGDTFSCPKNGPDLSSQKIEFSQTSKFLSIGIRLSCAWAGDTSQPVSPVVISSMATCLLPSLIVCEIMAKSIPNSLAKGVHP